MVKSVNPSFFRQVIYTKGEFAFDPDFTIQQAAKYAASNYPQSSLAPVFSEVWGFKKAAPTYQIVVIDSNANVHSMFREDDILIVSNVPNIKDVQRMELIYQLLLILSPIIAFFLFMILMGVLYG